MFHYQLLYILKLYYYMDNRNRRKKPQGWIKIAKERIDILFGEARKSASTHPKRANRYVSIARKLGMRYKVRIPAKHRRAFCHKCGVYLLPGSNVKIRTNPRTKSVEYFCLTCNKVNRYSYKKEQLSKP